jgi:ABC-type multidrug transport system fused ATPase/permease subunit
LRTEFFAHLHDLSLAFFDRERLGDVMSRVTDDVEEIEDLMLSGVASAVSYAFQLLFFTAALFYLNWQLAIVSLFVVPLFWLAARHFSRKIKTAAREERRRSGSIGAVAEESLSNAALVQAYNRKDEEVARFHRENEGSFAAQMAATRLGSLFSPLINMIELAGVVVVVAFGAYQLSRGNLTVGGLLVFMVFLGQLYGPIRGVSGLLNSFYSASAGAERIIEFLDEKPSVTERADAVELGRAEAAWSSTGSPSATPARRRRPSRTSRSPWVPGRRSRSSGRAGRASPRRRSSCSGSTTRTRAPSGSTATTFAT